MASSTVACLLIAFHWFNRHLCRLLLEVMHGIHLRDLLHNIVERRCMLTFQYRIRSLGCFCVADDFELLIVVKALIGEWRVGF